MSTVKVRYKQAALGAAWAVPQPLLTMVFCVVLSCATEGWATLSMARLYGARGRWYLSGRPQSEALG